MSISCVCVHLYFHEVAGVMLTERNISVRVSEWQLIESVSQTPTYVWQH